MFIVIASNSELKEQATLQALRGTPLESVEYTSCDSFFETPVQISPAESLDDNVKARVYTGLTCHPTDLAIGTEAVLIKREANAYTLVSQTYIADFGSEVEGKSREYEVSFAEDVQSEVADDALNAALVAAGHPGLLHVYAESIKNAAEEYVKERGV